MNLSIFRLIVIQPTQSTIETCVIHSSMFELILIDGTRKHTSRRTHCTRSMITNRLHSTIKKNEQLNEIIDKTPRALNPIFYIGLYRCYSISYPFIYRFTYHIVHTSLRFWMVENESLQICLSISSIWNLYSYSHDHLYTNSVSLHAARKQLTCSLTHSVPFHVLIASGSIQFNIRLYSAIKPL